MNISLFWTASAGMSHSIVFNEESVIKLTRVVLEQTYERTIVSRCQHKDRGTRGVIYDFIATGCKS